MANLKSQGCAIFLSDDASPEVFTEVGQVMSISGPDGSTGEIDVTNLASTIKEFVPSLPDMGTVSCETSWDHATTANNHAAINTAFLAQTTKSWQIRLSDSPQTVIAFLGFPNSFSTSIGVDDKVGMTFGVRITDTYSIT
jgi:hypothetical protein